MDKTVLVMFPLEAGRRLVEALDQNGLDLQAAFWFYESEADEWRLIIASPLVKELGPRKVYEKIRSMLAQMQPPLDISLTDVTVLSPSSNLIRSLRKVVHVGPGEPGVRLRRNVLDGVQVEEGYVYRMV